MGTICKAKHVILTQFNNSISSGGRVGSIINDTNNNPLVSSITEPLRDGRYSGGGGGEGEGGEISRRPMDIGCSVLYIIYKFRIQGYTRQNEVPCSRIQHRIPGEIRTRDLVINLTELSYV